MFRYNPKDASDCLPEGEYPAQLDFIEEKISSKGNPMLEVHWVSLVNGREYTTYDYIVNPGTLWKLKKIAKAWGLLRDFEEGTFDLTEYKGQTINLKLIVQQQEGYSDKNSVKDYLGAGVAPPKTDGAAQPFSYEPDAPLPPPPVDSDIPF